MTDFHALHYVLFFFTGLVAGTVDAIAGGGGLIMVPVLLATGMPAPIVLGTNKLGAAFGTASSAWWYDRQGAVSLGECRLGIAVTAIAAVGGAWTASRLPSDFLGHFIPWLLAAIVAFMVFRPTLGTASREQKLKSGPFYLLFGPLLGFYDGFFGPGVGSFWTFAFVLLLGLNFVRASAHARVMNFASNASALTVFALAGNVLLIPGLTLAAGQLIGGRIGASLAVTRGARFVRPIFLVMAGLTVLKLIYQRYFQS
ncbi:MAG TPA: TSUP family transporter [Candidatus Didemnitutus sp.]|nr:TSUP family transporter [Candidatus Didemnitutus sp.]